jgi:hypothetical protein
LSQRRIVARIPTWSPSATTGTTTDDMAAKTTRDLTCDDCYFRREGLCALAGNVPCPTFRPTKRSSLTPPRQPQLVPRQPEHVTVGRAA